MKTYLVLFLFLLAMIVKGNSTTNLVPLPSDVELTNERLAIDNSFSINLEGLHSERAEQGIRDFIRKLSDKTTVFINPEHFTNFENNEATLKISFSKIYDFATESDESYRLSVTSNHIILESVTDAGVLHGLATLIQLVQPGEQGFYFRGMNLQDSPRFKWRGLLIDVSRHFMPVEVIKRNIDAMSLVKLNVLHLHLTDDQGFRVECKTFPKLHQLGSDGQYYTHEQIKEIIEYADQRGIMVIPEFDIPGHTTSWFVGYSEIATLPGPYSIERGFGIKDPAMDPSLEKTYEFLDLFFKEMAALFPSPWIHIGGDEVNGKHWNESERISTFMKEQNISDLHQLQLYFNTRVIEILSKYNKKVVGWDEILSEGLPGDAIIQSWRGKEGLVNAAQNNYNTILSNGYYIDLFQPAGFHYLNDPLDESMTLTEEKANNVLGGEATMWAEFVTPDNIDGRIWPRTAAIAERFWSSSNPKDVKDMYRRLDLISKELEFTGVNHITAYERSIRLLSDDEYARYVKELLDVLEPLELYARHQHQQYTVFSPLTRPVDIIASDSRTAYRFNHLTDEYMKNKGSGELINLKSMLKEWEGVYQKLSKWKEVPPAIEEIMPHALNLSSLCTKALMALEVIAGTKENPGVEWNQNTLKLIEESKQIYGETELKIVAPIEKIIVEMIYPGR